MCFYISFLYAFHFHTLGPSHLSITTRYITLDCPRLKLPPRNWTRMRRWSLEQIQSYSIGFRPVRPTKPTSRWFLRRLHVFTWPQGTPIRITPIGQAQTFIMWPLMARSHGRAQRQSRRKATSTGCLEDTFMAPSPAPVSPKSASLLPSATLSSLLVVTPRISHPTTTPLWFRDRSRSGSICKLKQNGTTEPMLSARAILLRRCILMPSKTPRHSFEPIGLLPVQWGTITIRRASCM